MTNTIKVVLDKSNECKMFPHGMWPDKRSIGMSAKYYSSLLELEN